MREDTPNPEQRVADAFHAYFVRLGIPTVRIGSEEVTLGRRRAWNEIGFWIAYRVDPDDGGFPSLELYVHHPMMDDWHARIWSDGYVEELDAMHLWFRFDPEVPSSKEAARQEHLERNRDIAIGLHERGLRPQGHIHSCLRPKGHDLFLEGGGPVDDPELE
jgi:hypothetical protein